QVDVGDRRERRGLLRLVAEVVILAAVQIRRADAHAALARVRRRAAVGVVARRAVRLECIGRAAVRDAVTGLGDVALACRRAADGGALLIRRAGVGDAVAALREVARAGRGAADRRALAVRRAGRAVARARLGDVARACRRAADERAGRALERVGRAGRAGAGAVLGDVAVAGGRPALRSGADEDVGRAVVGDAVAAFGDVAGSGRRTADAGALRVGRAGGVRPRAVLRRVACARGRTADRRARLERVGRARRVGSVAGLGDVADAGRGAALGSRGDEDVRGAGVGHTVARLRDVAAPGRRTADRRALRVGRAIDSGPRAVLRRVTRAGRRTADRRRRCELVARAGAARP